MLIISRLNCIDAASGIVTLSGRLVHRLRENSLNLCTGRPHHPSGLGSSVGIVTGYGLDGAGIESRWGARFPAPVQTGPGAYPASCTMGTGSFPEVKSGQGVTLTAHPLLMQWSWKGRAILLLPLGAIRPVQSLSACTRVHFTFTLPLHHPKILGLLMAHTYVCETSYPPLQFNICSMWKQLQWILFFHSLPSSYPTDIIYQLN